MVCVLKLTSIIFSNVFLQLEWSRELLLEKWMKDPVECCQLAGVQAPSSLLKHASSLESSMSAETNDEINEIMVQNRHIYKIIVIIKIYYSAKFVYQQF